jgi:hypothetical protein
MNFAQLSNADRFSWPWQLGGMVIGGAIMLWCLWYFTRDN